MAILWGLVFSLLTIVYIWLVRPVLRIVEVVLAIFKRVSFLEIYVSTLKVNQEPYRRLSN